MLELVEGSVQSSLLTFFSVCNTYVALVKKRTRTRLQRHWHSVLLAWRLDWEMRRRLILHETGFTRSRLFTSYFIDVDTFQLFLNWFSSRVGDDLKYVCGRRIYACINTRKFKGLNSREIASLSGINKWFTWHVISIIAENKPHAHHKTHLRTMKVYNTRPS